MEDENQVEMKCEAMERDCCVVTGGRGFAARHLVVKLVQSGRWTVRIADLGSTVVLDEDEENGILGQALKSGQAIYISADLRDKSQLLKGLLKGQS